MEVFSLRSPSENPWQSSEMFRQCLETFVRPSDIFGEPSEISGKQSESSKNIARVISELGIKSIKLPGVIPFQENNREPESSHFG